MPIHTKAIEYRDGETELTGVLVWDGARQDRRPGVLVVHGGAGLDDHAKGRARKLAELGYVAFACDMYGKGVAGRDRIRARIMELRQDRAILCQRARGGLDVLAAQPQVDGRVAAVGYCFGGMTVLEMARSGMALVGVVSVHGSLEALKPADDTAITAKILVCHGAVDPHVPMAHVTGFAEEMGSAGADWQLTVYGGAMHGFTHEEDYKVPGVAYHAQADARSSMAIRDFFAEIFG